MLQENLEPHGLAIATEKIQRTDVVNYLGYAVGRQTIRPQKVSIRRSILKALNDYQRLLGDIN